MEPVACLGCCTLAPVVRIGESTFGHATTEKVPGILSEFLEKVNDKTKAPATEELRGAVTVRAEIKVGLGSCCMAKGSDTLFQALQQSVAATGAEVSIKRVGCVGMCHRTPLIEVNAPGRPNAFYAGLGCRPRLSNWFSAISNPGEFCASFATFGTARWMPS